MPKIILHLAPADARPELQGWHLRLYRTIHQMALGARIGLEIRPRDADITPATRQITDNRFDDGNLHILDDRSVQAKGVLNAAVAYFWEFWHLEPEGTKAFSPIGRHAYDPRNVPWQRARQFMDNQREKLVKPRLSRYAQTETRTNLPPGALAVFLQGSFPRRQGASEFDDLAMIETVCHHAGDRPIIVKPHPLVHRPDQIAQMQHQIGPDPRIIWTQANVHDILSVCAATVSINSTVALEGYLHRKPALLFGQTDFHHLAETVTQPQDFPAALTRALARDGGYAQYLAWYFLRHCLRISSPTLENDIWRRFAAAGFPKDRFLG